jgi:hypothetical protein
VAIQEAVRLAAAHLSEVDLLLRGRQPQAARLRALPAGDGLGPPGAVKYS